MTVTLEDAIAIAAIAHKGQLDKGGRPYVLHPLRVMLAVDTPVERMAAVFHDILEDTAVTIDDLRQHGFPQEVLDTVVCLTRREGEVYEQYIERIAHNPIARCVKLADLADNMSPSRQTGNPEKDQKRMVRYRAAWDRLTCSSH